ncbi:MAG: RhuM family protein [Nanoarchaeota archaeon]
MVFEKPNQFLMYTTPNGDIKVQVFFHNENIWLTQKMMAELFEIDRTVITKHLKNIFTEKELDENSVSAKIAHTANDGKKYKISFYNLDAIISAGYRVNSSKATQFRIWATKTLKDYMLKGFAIDDERLKNGTHFGKDYFKELLEKIRSIRTSERRIYQQITDIFAEVALDYNKNSEITKDFYASIQNKFHYAISGETASEIIHNNANSKKENMGLQTWKNSPKGRILKSDVIIAKNYLKENDIKQLERTISSFFDYIENVIENKKLLKMQDLAQMIDKFLSFNEFRILEDEGNISKQKAEEKAIQEYNLFNKTQKIESDFDKEIQKYLKK